MNTEHVHGENCNHSEASTDQEALQKVIADLQHQLNNPSPLTPEEEKEILRSYRRGARNKRKKARQDARLLARCRGERKAVEAGANMSQLLVQRKLREVVVVRGRTTRRERAKLQRQTMAKIQNIGKAAEGLRGQTNDVVVVDEVQAS